MFVPAIVAHIKDHLLMHYMKITNQALKAASDSGQLSDDPMQEAEAAVNIQHAIEQALPPEFMQILTQAFQVSQQLQPPQPQDPTQVAAEVQKQSIAQRAQSDQMKLQAQQQHDAQQLQVTQQKDQAQMRADQQKSMTEQQLQARQDDLNMQMETLQQDREDARKKAELDTRLQMNQEDNATAKDLAAVEVLSGNKIGVSTGTGINPNP